MSILKGIKAASKAGKGSSPESFKLYSANDAIKDKGLAPFFSKDLRQRITRLENLGGRVSSNNFSDILRGEPRLSDSQREKLFSKYKDEDLEFYYNSWKRFKDRGSGKAVEVRAESLDEALLRRMLSDVESHFKEQNLSLIKEHNKGKGHKEMLSFTKEVELRSSFPKGFDNIVIPQKTNILGDIENKLEKIKFDRLSPKTEGNVTSVNFSSLKKKGED